MLHIINKLLIQNSEAIDTLNLRETAGTDLLIGEYTVLRDKLDTERELLEKLKAELKSEAGTVDRQAYPIDTWLRVGVTLHVNQEQLDRIIDESMGNEELSRIICTQGKMDGEAYFPEASPENENAGIEGENEFHPNGYFTQHLTAPTAPAHVYMELAVVYTEPDGSVTYGYGYAWNDDGVKAHYLKGTFEVDSKVNAIQEGGRLVEEENATCYCIDDLQSMAEAEEALLEALDGTLVAKRYLY